MKSKLEVKDIKVKGTEPEGTSNHKWFNCSYADDLQSVHINHRVTDKIELMGMTHRPSSKFKNSTTCLFEI